MSLRGYTLTYRDGEWYAIFYLDAGDCDRLAARLDGEDDAAWLRQAGRDVRNRNRREATP